MGDQEYFWAVSVIANFKINIKIKSTVASLTMKLFMFLNTWINVYMYTGFSYYKITMEAV